MNLHELTPTEKILLVGGLWDSVASDEQLFPLTKDQKR
jgi:putative addiction module component (TIGR02574 family)